MKRAILWLDAKEKLDGNLKIKRTKEDQRYLRKNALSDEKSQIEKELKALKLEISKLQTENKQLKSLNVDLNKKAGSLQAIRTENEQLKNLNDDLDKKAELLSHDLNDKAESLQAIRTENEQLKNLNDDLNKKAELLSKDLNEKAESLKAIRTENEQLICLRFALNEEAKLLKSENEEAKLLNESLEKRLAEMRFEIVALKIRETDRDTLFETDEAEGAAAVESVDHISGTEGHCHGSEEIQLYHISDEEGNSFVWQSVNKSEEYKLMEIKMKKSLYDANMLVTLINEHVYEDNIDAFMRAAIPILFTMEFFLGQISYKIERDRVCVKDSKILKCLGKSLQTKLAKQLKGKDIGDEIQSGIQKYKKLVRSNPNAWVK